jgi:hypothetical protein
VLRERRRARAKGHRRRAGLSHARAPLFRAARALQRRPRTQQIGARHLRARGSASGEARQRWRQAAAASLAPAEPCWGLLGRAAARMHASAPAPVCAARRRGAAQAPPRNRAGHAPEGDAAVQISHPTDGVGLRCEANMHMCSSKKDRTRTFCTLRILYLLDAILRAHPRALHRHVRGAAGRRWHHLVLAMPPRQSNPAARMRIIAPIRFNAAAPPCSPHRRAPPRPAEASPPPASSSS